MDSTKQLYEFLLAHAQYMTDAWLQLREDDGSIYNINAPRHVVNELIEHRTRN
ncbi:hypothetical protein [Bacillus sp. REN3]|uniref:hypothetical protein n=1 Tax=Bacillus sp. REN3 TaxID=2802440 RepID=UPI001AEE6B72|nr:hypothetical protein [Bacillus sp. REN3]